MPRRSSKKRTCPASAEPPPVAGLIRRLAALLYDALLLTGVLFAATLLVLPLREGQAFAPNDPLYSGYLLAVAFAFFGWFWTHGGQTPGMRAWRIRLIAADGGAVSWRHSALRYACAPLSATCFGLGYFWSRIDREGRSWHDMASNTRVVRMEQE